MRSTYFSQSVEDPGMGLRFLQMSPQAKQAVSDFLSKRESLFFDED